VKRARFHRLASVAVAALLCLGVVVVIPGVAIAGPVLGDTTIELSADTDSAGLAEAFQSTATSGGTVSNLNVYVDSSSTASKLVAGIYTNNNGHPGTLLAQGSLSSPALGTWNGVAIPTTTVTAGTTYWLAILGASGGGTLAFRDRCCGGGTVAENNAQSSLSTLPGTWTSGPRWSDGPASIYAGNPPPPPPPPSQTGQWSSVISSPLVAIHEIALRNGNVLMLDGWQNPNQAQVFNPTTQTFTPTNNTFGLDQFCSAHVTLTDGRVLVVGGDGSSTLGTTASTIFDPIANTWSRVQDMHNPRWYPTATELGDGRVLVVSGNVTQTTWADTPEIYDPAANTWTLLPNISTPQVHEEEYPLSYLLPTGKVMTIAPSVGQSFLLDPTAQTWSAIGGSTLKNGTAAQYLPGKILYAGGGTPIDSANPAQANAQIIDPTSATPMWQPVASMNSPRYTQTLTVLPDGKVLAVGGSTSMSQTADSTAVLSAEEWDPSADSWTTLASMQVPRIYHSTAVLLPDGRVLVAGSGHQNNVTGPGEYNTQFYSPPYLFNGPRPTITSAPTSVTYGTPMTVQTPDAASIASVSLVSFGADTHTLDMNQHFVPLSFTADSGGLTVSSPTSANVAPPGYYMLFLVNGNGVPSVAATLHIGAPVDNIPPIITMTAPADGATVSGSAVTVSANATDNLAVSSVQFLLDGNPLGAPVVQAPYTMNWDSTTVANGSHTLSARATDPAGNIGTATPVTVTVANAPPVGPSIDASVSADGVGPASVTISTSTPGDLLLAFVGSDGGTSRQTVTVSGGGLAWTLVKAANSQNGDAEVWSARATDQLSGATITATQSTSGFDESLTVVAFKGAGGVGASVTKSAATGAPSVTLTTTKAQSMILGVGNDYDRAVARTLGTGQMLVHQWVDTGSGDTYWAQRISALAGPAGSPAKINDTAPTGDRWNLVAVEVTSS
jgi:Domain of unknown function (DUF1929)/Bacterial Ig domain/Kelch motif